MIFSNWLIIDNKCIKLKLNNTLEQVYILTARKDGLKETLNSIDKLRAVVLIQIKILVYEKD